MGERKKEKGAVRGEGAGGRREDERGRDEQASRRQIRAGKEIAMVEKFGEGRTTGGEDRLRGLRRRGEKTVKRVRNKRSSWEGRDQVSSA